MLQMCKYAKLVAPKFNFTFRNYFIPTVVNLMR